MKIRIIYLDRNTPDFYYIKRVCRDGSFLMTKIESEAREFVSQSAAQAAKIAMERRPGNKIVSIV